MTKYHLLSCRLRQQFQVSGLLTFWNFFSANLCLRYLEILRLSFRAGAPHSLQRLHLKRSLNLTSQTYNYASNRHALTFLFSPPLSKYTNKQIWVSLFEVHAKEIRQSHFGEKKGRNYHINLMFTLLQLIHHLFLSYFTFITIFIFGM